MTIIVIVGGVDGSYCAVAGNAHRITRWEDGEIKAEQSSNHY